MQAYRHFRHYSVSTYLGRFIGHHFKAAALADLFSYRSVPFPKITLILSCPIVSSGAATEAAKRDRDYCEGSISALCTSPHHPEACCLGMGLCCDLVDVYTKLVNVF